MFHVHKTPVSIFLESHQGRPGKISYGLPCISSHWDSSFTSTHNIIAVTTNKSIVIVVLFVSNENKSLTAFFSISLTDGPSKKALKKAQKAAEKAAKKAEYKAQNATADVSRFIKTLLVISNLFGNFLK